MSLLNNLITKSIIILWGLNFVVNIFAALTLRGLLYNIFKIPKTTLRMHNQK